MFFIKRGIFLAPEDAGSGGAGEPAEAPAGDAGEEIVPASTPGEPAGAAAGDTGGEGQAAPPEVIPAWAKELREEVNGWRSFYQQDQAERHAKDQEFRRHMLGAFAPEVLKREQPRAATVEDLQRMSESMLEQMQEQILVQQHRALVAGELEAVKTKYPDVFDFIPDFEARAREHFVQTGRGPLELAKDFSTSIAAGLAKRSAAVVDDKVKKQSQVRGTGAPGKAPPAKQDDGLRGRNRFLKFQRRAS